VNNVGLGDVLIVTLSAADNNFLTSSTFSSTHATINAVVTDAASTAAAASADSIATPVILQPHDLTNRLGADDDLAVVTSDVAYNVYVCHLL